MFNRGNFNQQDNYNNDYYDDYMDNNENYGYDIYYDGYEEDYSNYDNVYNNNDYNYNNNQQNNYGRCNSNTYNDQDPSAIKRKEKEMKKKNRYINKARKKSKKKDIQDYGYSTGYENEEIYYDDEGNQIVHAPKSSLKSTIIIALCFCYLCFIGLGVMGTTFTDGYKPQIVSSTIRGERVIYEKCMKEIEALENTDTFGGASELQEIYKTKNYQGRIAVLKKTLSKYQQKVEDMESAAYKTDNSDYINVEMLDMVKDLYNTQITTIVKTIRFYESMSGYSSTTEALQSEQDALLEQHQVYKNKLANYKVRFQEIKRYELKLED